MPPPSVVVDLAHGVRVRLRRAEPGDRDALRAGFVHLSDDSRYRRFFTAVPKLSGVMLNQLTDLDDRRVAVAAFDPDRPSEVGTDDGYGVGVGRLIVTGDDPLVAEFALAVIDDYQGNGLGRTLMHCLVAVAAAMGLQRVKGFVLRSNTPMIALMGTLGAAATTDEVEPGVVAYEFAVSEALRRLPDLGSDPDAFAPMLVGFGPPGAGADAGTASSGAAD